MRFCARLPSHIEPACDGMRLGGFEIKLERARAHLRVKPRCVSGEARITRGPLHGENH
jgi:hypothetical protein